MTTTSRQPVGQRVRVAYRCPLCAGRWSAPTTAELRAHLEDHHPECSESPTMDPRACRACGEPFAPRVWNQYHCSLRCQVRNIHQRERARERHRKQGVV
jgi:predicted Zn-ribbon and HTH transcriptional regulator